MRKNHKCFALDRDGTVETSKGPVKLGWIRELLNGGNPVYCIGNRKLCDEAGIPMAQGRDKPERLSWIKSEHPDAEEYIVVDDMEIDVDTWTYVDPDKFRI